MAPAHGSEPPPGPPLPDPGPVEAALAQAKADGKPVILEFSTAWCEPCKIFAAKILPRPEVQAALASIAFISYDAEKGSGVAAAARFHVTGYPTFMVVDESGAVLATKTGIDPTDATWFLEFVRNADLAAPESHVLAELKAHPGDAKVEFAAGHWYAVHERAADALPHLDAAAAADPKDAAGVGADALWQAGELRRAQAGKELASKDLAAYALAFPHGHNSLDAVTVAVLGTPLPVAARHKLWQAVIDAREKDAPGLNEVVYRALATGDLDDALDAANRQVALLKDDANSLDTLAEVQHYRHDNAAALATEDRALALPAAAGLHDDLVKDRARFAAADDAGSNTGVVETQHRVAALWKRLGTIDLGAAASEGGVSAAPPGTMEKAQAYMAARQEMLDMIAKACAAQAGDVKLLSVTLDPDDGSAPPKVAIDDPAASPALRQCVTDMLGRAELPKPPDHIRIKAPTELHF